ncbi:hypothetical protein [Alkalihalobacillus sp. TS-13]|nr:hypothetical protein [Alkalihalobacillus sp. TS-13]
MLVVQKLFQAKDDQFLADQIVSWGTDPIKGYEAFSGYALTRN